MRLGENPPTEWGGTVPPAGEHEVRIKWGTDGAGGIETYSFATLAEWTAFLYGVDQGTGWLDYELPNEDGTFDSDSYDDKGPL